ncbi:hypothetical protein SARC_09696 [Sphaeroforma arctica JP610]|uniref:CMP/dCMP-type deaminase domain-containing protein n=1 Tax=Sphaeroforma arctica JP610 TaxID=667725 RepID=A0A0L0FPF3_9EUKA|nr:hypothetical protein, variant [Sphaeroforma arctica JP610]XP_014151756.1 hypothetical protein SARC_09696 [Sphaeroforma arctica JP610]KNC77853.1 hypothetical protein, variant [Sphaeroforma arctica JP610]KNC77854.1 hypothetical protein SARC_09696 [Sphaeroforma arctica JP610]|eukprot:XP_014151755.1 hypothetical protein, variant [Sphaeroforma arctica JP610]
MSGEASSSNEKDLKFLRIALEVAARSRKNGNHPFGAIIVDENDNILCEGENTVVTGKDCTGHAETNVMRKATNQYTPEELEKSTLYTSTEPCAMCAGAIHWGRMGRMVYALSESGLYDGIGAQDPIHILRLPCRDVFACSDRKFEVAGPFIQDEGWTVHEGFWN